MKKTELFSDDFSYSVCVEIDSNNDLVVLSITEYDVDEKETTPELEVVKPVSATEIYLNENEVNKIARALLEILREEGR